MKITELAALARDRRMRLLADLTEGLDEDPKKLSTKANQLRDLQSIESAAELAGTEKQRGFDWRYPVLAVALLLVLAMLVVHPEPGNISVTASTSGVEFGLSRDVEFLPRSINLQSISNLYRVTDALGRELAPVSANPQLLVLSGSAWMARLRISPGSTLKLIRGDEGQLSVRVFGENAWAEFVPNLSSICVVSDPANCSNAKFIPQKIEGQYDLVKVALNDGAELILNMSGGSEETALLRLNLDEPDGAVSFDTPTVRVESGQLTDTRSNLIEATIDYVAYGGDTTRALYYGQRLQITEPAGALQLSWGKSSLEMTFNGAAKRTGVPGGEDYAPSLLWFLWKNPTIGLSLAAFAAIAASLGKLVGWVRGGKA